MTTANAQEPNPTRLGSARVGPDPWSLIVVAVSIIPVLGLFTTTRIFFVRDLSLFFWSRHLWLRHTIFSGQAPWWDPYVASGQSAIADALNQLLMPLTLAIRLLPSDVVSFNLWVALPLPIAALGMYEFLLTREAGLKAAAQGFSPAWAAACGALMFAFCGPVMSMLNTPNLAWSVALMPWVLAAAEARGGRREARVAIAFALQGLCGEPVTWAATGFLTLTLSFFRLEAAATETNPVASAFRRNVAGLFLGALIASAQLVPTALAGVRAHRGLIATPDFWSLHPLSLWETLAPHLFGNYYDAFLGDLPWMGALNFGRGPFFYSIYLGPLVFLLAAAGLQRGWRRNWVWTAVAILFTVAALGGYTPAYPLLRKVIPQLLYLRFPVKYIVFAEFAVIVLAAEGLYLLVVLPPKGGSYLPHIFGGIGLVGLAVTLILMAKADALQALAHSLAVSTHLKDPAAGAAFLARVAPPLALRACAMLSAGALLLRMARGRPHVIWMLAAITCTDVLVTNSGLNLTMDVSKLTPPAWFVAATASQSRLYIGGRVRGDMNTADPDAVPDWQIPAEATAMEGRMELNAELPMAPSGWRVREALSYDLPSLWPFEYESTVRRFERAAHEERDAFLRRSGVRWCVVPRLRQSYGEQDGTRIVADVPDWNMRVFDCHPAAARVAFASQPAGIEALFDPRWPDGEPGAGDARIVEDLAQHVTIEATAARDTYLVLRDSYDPSWHADVDGHAVPVIRAYGIHRAVALTPGRHVIRFTYRPGDLFVGLTLAGFAVAMLAGFSRARRTRVHSH